MPFTLFCLGTDVAYTPGDYLANAVGPDIKLRETLSAIAGYIAEPAIARAPVAIDTAKADFNDIHYLSADVVVLDGADTIGAKVHDKIAKGLMVILDALMQGERSINIVGFSRGAVQSLHITHELQRIKDACKNTALESLDKAMLINIICTAGTAWSTNHLNNYHKPFLNAHLTDEHVAALSSALLDEADETKIRLNLFALDPVPGLCDGDRAALSPIRALEFWGASAKRHYHVPEIVSRYSTILHEDECSWAFNLAIPKQTSDRTAMQYMNLPGFHGTGNGSPMLHDPARPNNPGDDYTKRRGVQTIVFYKILTFLVEVGVQLRLAPEAAEYHLDNEYRDFLEQNTPMARALLFERHYDEVLENKSFYRKLRQDWYTGLGRDPVESSTYQRKVMGHVNTQHPRPLSDYVNFNIEKEQPYVNAEHYQLKMTAALRTLSVLNAVEWSEQELPAYQVVT